MTDIDELKAVLGSPFALLALMFAASIASGLKQIATTRQQGGDITLAGYMKFWPETAATIVGNVIAFVVLVLTDQLNFASALGIGYGINSVADLVRPGGRSAAVTDQAKRE